MQGEIDAAGWIRCPLCGSKTRTKVNNDTVVKHFPLFCPKCGQSYIIGIENRIVTSVEPDAKTQSR